MPQNARGGPGQERAGNSESDDAVFAGVRRGSEPHFNQLYDRYFPRVYGFVYARIRNHSDAEELTQETFTVVFRSAGAYRGQSSPLAWIFGVAKNTVNNHLRRARLRSDKLDGIEPESVHATESAWTANPEEELTLQRFLDSWDDCLRELTPWQVDVFRMRHLENIPIDEIAARMERSNDAIRSSLYRVKRMLLEAGDIATGGIQP